MFLTLIFNLVNLCYLFYVCHVSFHEKKKSNKIFFNYTKIKFPQDLQCILTLEKKKSAGRARALEIFLQERS